MSQVSTNFNLHSVKTTNSLTNTLNLKKKLFAASFASPKKEGIFSYATSVITKKSNKGKFKYVNKYINSVLQKTNPIFKNKVLVKGVRTNVLNNVLNETHAENTSVGDRKQIVLRTASNRLSYFSRRGNLPRRERNYQKYFTARALLYKKEKKRTPISYYPSFFYVATPFMRLKTRRRGGRRARLRQKVTFISRHAGERQGYLLFVKTFRTNSTNSASTSKIPNNEKYSFRTKLQSQREFLYKSAMARRRDLIKSKANSYLKFGSNKVKGTNKKGFIKKPKLRDRKFAIKHALNRKKANTSAKSLQEIRNEIHRRAFSIAPGRWSWIARNFNKPRKPRKFRKGSKWAKRFKFSKPEISEEPEISEAQKKKLSKTLKMFSRHRFYKGFDRISYLRQHRTLYPKTNNL